MPKITRHGGPSNAALPELEYVPGEPLPEIPSSEGAKPLDPVPGEEESSPGTSSATSSAKEQTSPEPSEKPLPKRAPRTGNRSKKDRTGSSTARSTGGAQTAPTSGNGFEGE